MFLWSEWIPLGHFLKVFKVDPDCYGIDNYQEFLLTNDTDISTIIEEALQWMDR